MDWDRATLAITLLAIDPVGLAGVVVRARSGPVRDAFGEVLGVLPQPFTKLHPAMDDEALFGGIDLTETLSKGKLALRRGLLGRGGTAALSMAERCDGTLAARLAIALDNQSLRTLIAFDEGADADEHLPLTLGERLAFYIDLEMPSRDIGLLCDPVDIAEAQAVLGGVQTSDDVYEALVLICEQLGIETARAPVFALRAARAHAALFRRKEVIQEDIEVAAGLCLAHRATRLPAPQEPSEPDAQEPHEPGQSDDTGSSEIGTLDDRVLEAVMALLPEGLLDQFRPKGSVGRGSGSGAKQRGNRRGRPKPSRAGRLSGKNRLDLIATLRTAAPWQKMRGADGSRVIIAPSDFRIKQFEEQSDRLLIFAVDASGSAAIARLGEAKGAVELLLADAYSRRDHVSLVSFRGTGAQVLLSPTRSLVQTKKRLAALPGGGGTPLAAGLLEALNLARHAKGQGMTPCIVLLTDGRANISLDGSPDRPQAAQDARAMAGHIRASGTDAIVLDLGTRPATFLEELAREMDGLYMPLPRADARKMSGAVTAALAG